MRRRDFLGSALVAGIAGALQGALGGAEPGPDAPPRGHVLLRSSWQTVNIGDIGHTPGLLRLLDQHLPGVAVTLWPTSIGNGVEDMLRRAFPRLRIARGGLDAAGQPTSDELRAAFAAADLMVHGSGPGLLAQQHLAGWRAATGKPYGVYGITVGAVDEPLRDLLSGARFVFCRETTSLALIRARGVTAPLMDFAPDATFAFHLRDETRAAAWLDAHGLGAGGYLCAIPRLRWTPYHRIHQRAPTARDDQRDAYNARFVDVDHAKLREAICAWVRTTGLPVVACPEMTYAVPLAKEQLVDPLPEDVRARVVWRDSYWLPDEAAAVYARAGAMISCEMHSPIIAAAAGIPAVYVRQPTDTSKGQMWRDIGLEPWIHEIDQATGADLAATVLAIAADRPAALARMAEAMAGVRRRQEATLRAVAPAA